MIAIPNIEKPKKVDGIKIDFHFEDGRIESHIIGIEEIIDIVPCRECKNSSEYDMPPIDPKIELSCDVFWHSVSPNDFCSGGERRTDPNNCKECELANNTCDHHICLKALRERQTHKGITE